MDVTGRDRIKFFKRPVMPNTAPAPCVRYSRELTQSETDIKKREEFLRQQQISASSIAQAYNHKANPSLLCTNVTMNFADCRKNM